MAEPFRAPLNGKNQRGRAPHGDSPEIEEEARPLGRPAQRLAPHSHHPAGGGIDLHVRASAGEDQPGPGHPGRPVGRAHGEGRERPGRVDRGHGEEPRHHREPCERARRLGGRGAGAGHRPDPRADPRSHEHRGRARHHRQDRQAGVRAPRLVHRPRREDQDRERPVRQRGHHHRRAGQPASRRQDRAPTRRSFPVRTSRACPSARRKRPPPTTQ